MSLREEELVGTPIDAVWSGRSEAKNVWTAPESAPRRASGGRASARSDASQGEGPDTLGAYMRSIARARVLSREEQHAIAADLERHREAFLDEVYASPRIAAALVTLWRRRLDAGHVTAVLAGRHTDGDHSPAVDRALGDVEKNLERMGAIEGRTSERATRERARLGRERSAALRGAGLAFEVIVETFAVLERGSARLDADERARMRRARRILAMYDEAKQTFVRHNLKLVIRFAKQYRNMGVPFLDLVQEGNLGLIRAVEKFDHHRGHKFSTYAAWWIHQALIRAVQKLSRTVRTPSHIYDLQLRYKRVEGELRGRTEQEPGRADVAEALGLSPREVDRLVATMSPISSTDAPLAGTEDLTLDDALADDSLPDPAEELDRSASEDAMRSVLSVLDERERMVIECRFGLAGEPEQTLQVVGDRLGLSRERVRQIEARALVRLRGALQ